MKRNMALGAIVFLAAVFVPGCANYGVIKPTRAQDVTIETLAKNWADFTVYWTGLNRGEPTALLFDPKGDGKTLTGASDRWYEVKSQESLAELIGWLKFNRLYPPYVWRVVGPDGQFYGYIYTGYTQFVMKAVNKDTMQVYGMPLTLRGEDGDFREKD